MDKHNIATILFEKMCSMVDYYPEDVYKVEQNTNREGFFPVCNGLYKMDDKEKIEILVVGHDFGDIDYYNKIISGKKDDTREATFRGINNLFPKAGIDLNKCFFTNSLVGLRKSGKMVGDYKAFENEKFQRENLKFLLYQIETIRPKVIITLGKPAHDIFCKLNKDIMKWENGVMKDANLGYIENVEIGSSEYMLVSLVHPCKRHLNIKNRCFIEDGIEYKGDEAEVKMLSNINKVLE